jgi:hypothetical protein
MLLDLVTIDRFAYFEYSRARRADKLGWPHEPN